MKESDFPQFDDPRVREVMAAAANLVEELHRDYANLEIVVERRCDDLETALFAAQHSAPRATCQECGGPGYHYPQCVQHPKPSTHEKPIEFDKWGYGTPEVNQFLVDGSKPGGKAFIGAIEETLATCKNGCECPRCGMESDYPLKRCTKCWGDGVTQCQCEVKT